MKIFKYLLLCLVKQLKLNWFLIFVKPYNLCIIIGNIRKICETVFYVSFQLLKSIDKLC